MVQDASSFVSVRNFSGTNYATVFMRSNIDHFHFHLFRCILLRHPVHSLTPPTLYGHASQIFPVNLCDLSKNPVNYEKFTECKR